MLDALPKGWVRTTLGEVCLPVATIQPEDSPSTEFTYFDIGGINNQTNTIAETKTIVGRNAPSRARQAVHKGDILFSTVRTYLRKIARVEQDYPNPVASTGFTVIRAAEGVASQFLFYQILSEDFLQPLHLLQTGGSYPAVRDRDVFAQPILLPPAAEQERIVAKLNAALSGVERAEMAARRGQERLKSYRAAVLTAAVTGELTREWRESQRKSDGTNRESGEKLLQRLLDARRARWEEAELQRLRAARRLPTDDKWRSRYPEPSPPKIVGLPQLPQEWSWTNLSQLKVYSIYGPRFSRSAYAKDGVAVLRTTDIEEGGRVSLETCPRLLMTNDEYEKYKVEPGDLLITRTGSIGTLAIFNDTVQAIPGAYLLHYRLVDPGVVQFVYTFLRSPEGQKRLWGASAGSGRQNLSAPGLESIPVPLPPITEQTEIVREVERRLAAANRLATSLNHQLERASAARQSLLREAFTGHLVPQYPMDEPASVLLDRIRAAREAEAQKPKGKRMPKSKSPVTRRSLLDVLRENERPMKLEHLFNEAGFTASQVDLFYRELASLRDKLKVDKPKGSNAKSWPYRAHVMLKLKEN